MSVALRHAGAATASSTGSTAFSSGPVDTSFSATYQHSKQGQVDVADATSQAPQALNLENVAKVKALILTATGNSCKVLLTSSAGTTQAVNLSSGGLIVIHLPTAGDQITAISFVGDGTTVSYFIAGDA